MLVIDSHAQKEPFNPELPEFGQRCDPSADWCIGRKELASVPLSGHDQVAYHQILNHAPQVTLDCEWSTLSEVVQLLQYRGLCSAEMHRPIFRRRRVRAGQSLFSMGQAFSGLYLVRHGNMKTVITHAEGTEHVMSFSMQGDILGAEGACQQHYGCQSFALLDCEVIRLPVDEYFSTGHSGDGVGRMLYWTISREVSRQQLTYAITHAAKSEIRVARFLIEQSERHAALGHSAKRFTLPMTRRDIGSYLNVTLETVSRALSSLNHLHIIDVTNREIVIHSLDQLQAYEG
jgi:CRP/FNR family transcriptional regulator